MKWYVAFWILLFCAGSAWIVVDFAADRTAHLNTVADSTRIYERGYEAGVKRNKLNQDITMFDQGVVYGFENAQFAVCAYRAAWPQVPEGARLLEIRYIDAQGTEVTIYTPGSNHAR